MRRVPWTALLSFVLLAGCAPRATVPALGATLSMSDHDPFGRVARFVEERGYLITSSDPAAGRLTVDAHSRRSVDTASFTLQCYSDGFVEVIPTGNRVTGDGTHYTMPAGMAEEYTALVIALGGSVSTTGWESASRSVPEGSSAIAARSAWRQDDNEVACADHARTRSVE